MDLDSIQVRSEAKIEILAFSISLDKNGLFPGRR